MQFGNRQNQKSFSQVPQMKKPRSTFNRSFEVHDTYQFDYIETLFTDVVSPGDEINMTAKLFARLTTQLKPVMDRIYASVEWFFVPDRLVWTNQKKFMGEQDNPGDSTDFINPYMTSPVGGFTVGSEFDHMNLRPGVAGYLINNTKPLRAKLKVYNDWYRDENLDDSVVIPMDDGPDADTDFPRLVRNKAHDYFTSALKSRQKGPAVSLPLGTTAPVISNSEYPLYSGAGVTDRYLGMTSVGTAEFEGPPPGINGAVAFGSETGLQTDLSAATAATLYALREAATMQQFLEMDNTGGTRYVETIPNHFGAILPDFTAQRSEFLGGGHFNLNVFPVPQTSESNTGKPQGNLAAYATLNVEAKERLGFTKSFNEWGTVLGLITFRAAISYQQGLNRFWSYSTKYDYPWPIFAGVGDQAIRNDEIYVDTNNTTNAAPWAFQERYAERKYRPSEIRGEFRSDASNSLDVYHQAEEFVALPAFNDVFMKSSTPIDRLLAVGHATSAPIQLDAYFDYFHTAVLPVHSIPGLKRF